jgi:glycosyltransferase involved in cell wall biosynthesis
MAMPEGEGRSRGGTLSKALILTTDDPWKRGGVGGKHTHIRMLSEGLSQSGVRTDIVTVRETPAFRFLRLYPGALRRRVLATRDERYEHYSGQYGRQLARDLRGNALDQDVANPHDPASARCLDEAMRRKGVRLPVVLTLHGYLTWEAASDGELTEGSPQYARSLELEKQVHHSAWRVVCVDTRIRDHVHTLSGIDGSRVTVLPNAVDTETFAPPTEAQRREARTRLGSSPTTPVILCPRRLVAKNGVDRAVLAMRSVAKVHPEAVLLVAGDGPQRREIEALVDGEGLARNVRLLGSIPHARILDHYISSDIVVIPSVVSSGVMEATSLSMLEGMATARPVVVTDIGGLKETVQDGRTGLVVRQGDPEAIASAVLDLLRDPARAKALGTAAREHVEKHHSKLAHAKRMLEEYRLAVAQGPQ